MATRRASTPRKTSTPQRRRSAEQARREILDAAEQQLRERGPDSIRLQDVARVVGVSHPTVLYHFGSRDELVRAVVQRAFETLQSELIGAFQISEIGERETATMLDRGFQALGEGGLGRLLAWLSLLGGTPPPSAAGTQIRLIAEAAHAQRQRRHGAHTADFEDTLFVMLLAALTMFAEGVAGDALRTSAGLSADRATTRRFRSWFARLLVDHINDTKTRARRRPKR